MHINLANKKKMLKSYSFDRNTTLLAELHYITFKKCYSAIDCVGSKEKSYCNHDYDVYGYCEECRAVRAACYREEFVCEKGAKSCNEMCEGNIKT